MLRATVKSLLARKLRLVLTALAVVFGVAFTAGTFVLTDTALKSFDDLFGNAYAGTDVVVQGTSAFSSSAGGGGLTQEPVPESLLPDVQAVDGVGEAQGVVTSQAAIIDPASGDQISSGGAPQLANSYDSTVTPVASGTAPSGPDQVAIDVETATDHDLSIGQRVRIVTTSGPQEFTISGTVRFGQANGLLGATLAVFDLPTAQKLFDSEEKFDFIYVQGDGSVTPDQLAGRVSGVLPKGFEAITAQSAAQQQQDQISQGLGYLRTFFLVFGFVALFVGAFIIFNTFNIVVTQRSRELALFRALGATRRQVLTSVIIESLVVGLIASIVGVLLGVPLALGLKALISAFGLKLPPTALVIAPRTVIVSLILGTSITVAAAISPARRASRLAPIEALRESAAPGTSTGLRAVVGALVTLAGAGAVALGLFGGVSKAGLFVGAGAAVVLLGITILTPLFARPLAATIGRPFRRRVSGKLGSENANRNPRRTASTSAALMIGLGLVAFVAVFAASLKTSTSATLDQVLAADFTISSPNFSTFSPQLAQDLRKDPTYTDVSALRQAEAHVKQSDTFVVGVDPATAPSVMHVAMTSGSLTDLAQPNTVIVSRTEADSKGFAVGSTLDMVFQATGPQQLTVVGTFEPNDFLNDYAISLDTYDANVPQTFDDAVFANAAPGVSVAQAKAKLDAFVKQNYPNVEATDQAQTKQRYLSSINGLLTFVTALLLLSILISLFGIVNTLGLSIYERIRELGLLRAVGMGRRQVKRMIRVEAVIIAVLGAVLGLAIGILFGWAMQQALKDVGVSSLTIPVGQLAVMLIVAAFLGVIAAIWPARRAAKLNVLEAITYE
jgi:putative ABC transport system permease protein